MKILIVSALYPPDVEDPAPYIKELATRLSHTHTVSILTYGTIPEAIPGVNIQVVPKHLPALRRLVAFTTALFSAAKQADHILIHNAPSTEAPAALAGLVYGRKMSLLMSDQKINYTGWRALIHRFATTTVNRGITIELPLPRPEIYPFEEYPETSFRDYETTWETHLTAVFKTITAS